MRGGVLADSEARMFFPQDLVTHERHFGVPHLQKHGRFLRKRKSGRPGPQIKRPTAPYMDHYQLAQLFDPLNPKPHAEALAVDATKKQSPRPTLGMQAVVEDYMQQHSEVMLPSNFGLVLPEVAYFLHKAGLPPSKFLTTEPNQSLVSVFQEVASTLPMAEEGNLLDLKKQTEALFYQEAPAPAAAPAAAAPAAVTPMHMRVKARTDRRAPDVFTPDESLRPNEQLFTKSRDAPDVLPESLRALYRRDD